MDERRVFHGFLARLIAAPEADLADVAATHLAEQAVFDVSAPIGRLEGRQAVLDGLIRPIRAALDHAHRRDLIFIGGRNTRAEGGQWLAAVAHVAGIFRAPLFGVAPNGKMVFLRFGEFYRTEGNRIVQARIIFDLLHLLVEIGRYPLGPHSGTPIAFPPPETLDGVCPTPRAGGAASLRTVEAMLGSLHVYDPDTFGSDYQTSDNGLWARDFMWYGPGGIGSTTGWQGFVDHHRAGFLRAFPDRKGGNHYCRIGDGAYAAVSGWPSMTMTHRDSYLGVPATGRALTLRVMDFYRCAGGKIAENWVLLDYVDLLAQMGVDIRALAAAEDAHHALMPAPGA
jgi:predicted ester cyclase